jgi:RHS repeat-associated protein
VTASVSVSNNGVICSGVPVTFTVNISPATNQTYSYQWFSQNGQTPIPGQTSSTLTVSTVDQYKVLINSTCYNNMIACPTIISSATLGTLSPISGSANVPANTASSTYTASAANASSYTWTIAPSNAGAISGTGATGTVNWNTTFSGIATISVNANGYCAIDPPANFAVAYNSNNYDYNYIQVTDVRVPNITTVAGFANLPIGQKNVTYTYFDGLGRPIQAVMQGASAAGNDVVQPSAYDQLGRQVYKYLPYTISAGAAGSFRYSALVGNTGYATSDQYSFYQLTGQNYLNNSVPFFQKSFEVSPLDRVTEQGEPGSTWQLGGGHTIKPIYTFNNNVTWASNPSTSMQVALYTATINSNGNGSRSLGRLNNTATYNSNQLKVTVTADENWSPSMGRAGTTEEYKDILGHVVLKRVYNNNNGTIQVLSTYYVYDTDNLLAFVLTPMAMPDNTTTAISQTTLNNLCYQYQYDERRRMTAKKLPGKGWEYLVYNKADQIVATQDSSQRINNQWIMTKYDGLGREIMTGIWNNNNTAIAPGALKNSVYAAPQWDVVNTSSATTGYTISSYPLTLNTILTINYYDGYTGPNTPANYSFSGASNMTTGLLTAAETTVLNTVTSTQPDMLLSVNYYDNLGRVTNSYVQHYLGGHTSYSTNNYDAVTASYNFANQVTTTTRQHYTKANTTAPKVVITNTFDYDQVGRRLHNTEQITGSNGVAQAAVGLSLSIYNELGQLYNKNINGVPGGGTVANVTLGAANSVASGQTLNVTAINSIVLSPGFSAASGSTFTAQVGGYLQTFVYKYNERGWLTSLTPSVGGNYAETIAYNNPTGSALPQYNGNISQFSYNSPNMALQYGQPTSYINTVNYTYDNLNRLTQSQSSLAKSDETATYDLMGNISTLNRTGPAAASLGYTYLNSGQSNQLATVTNNSSAYRSYSYDGNGNATSDGGSKSIFYNLLNLPQTVQSGATTLATYYYSADNEKLRNVSTTAGTWDYIKGIQYLNGKIDFIQTEEGKVSLYSDSITYKYSYDLKDYLGNVRASYDNGGTGSTLRTIQENDYYPFGLSQLYYDNSNGNRYLYNGKEQQFDLTSQYDYGARFYDPVIARWNTPDPLAENGMRWSPYNYVENSPIRNIDPDGMWVIDPNVGADGLTNEQWIRDSNPLATGDAVADKNANREKEVEVNTEIAKATNSGNQITNELNTVALFKKAFDIIWKNSNPGGENVQEWLFEVYEDADNYYAANFRTSNEAGEVSDYEVKGFNGKHFVGNVHTHPYSKKEGGYTGIGPSSSDIAYLNYVMSFNKNPGAFVMVEAGTRRYALVITDPQKAQAFFNLYNPGTIGRFFKDIFEDPAYSQLSFSEKVEIAIRGVINHLGDNGIGAYKTDDDKKQNFVKF